MAHRYRLVPAASQLATLLSHCADARYVWNLALEQANCYRPGRPTPGPAERFRQLAEARKGTWLGQGSSSVQQQALRDFDRALANWWGGSHRRPRWRRRGLDEGFCVRDVRVRRLNGRWAELSVPKCSPVRFRLSRPLPESFGMARVTLDRAGRWHVAFSAPQPTVERAQTGATVGLDLGVAATVATSDGALHRAGRLSDSESSRLRRLERRRARQVKGSARRRATSRAIARIRAKEADRRKDFCEQLSTSLVRCYDLICLEDLAVARMVRSAKGTVDEPGTNVAQKRGLNRAISAQGWAMLRRRIEDEATTCGVTVIAVNPSFTSQRCSDCGHTEAKNRKSQAAFACRACGHEANADVNAANNILAAGLTVTARGGLPDSGPDEARTRPVAA